MLSHVSSPGWIAAWRWLFAAFSPLALTLVLVAAQSSHAQFSYPREQTKLDITITAEAGVNPDDKGRAAPIMVRIYELKSEGTFESADYFSLYSNDKALIGSDLLVRDEFILRPGDVKTIRRKSHPDLAAIGVVAGYRDLAQADWRAVQKIDPAPEVAWYRAVLPANKVELQIDLQVKGIQLTPLK
jgi:type VI secretion system protein VasD